MAHAPSNTAGRPLLYTAPLPLDSQKHKDLALKSGLNLSFAAGIHAVPVNLIEFPQLSHYYPIVFSPDDQATPVAILGLTENVNLFVNQNGNWINESAYIPAYIRRYPFIFAAITGSDQLTLCVDDNPTLFSENSDLRLFGADGKPTTITSNALEFCKSFHAASLQTREFCEALGKSGLLVDREAEIPIQNGTNLRFSGFRIIDEAKWAQADDALILEWKKRGWLAFVYAHLFASAQWTQLARLHLARTTQKAA